MLKIPASPQRLSFGNNRRLVFIIALIALLALIAVTSVRAAFNIGAGNTLSLLPESFSPSLVTSSVSSPSIAPYAGDDRICGPDAGGSAQTAALYFAGTGPSSLLMYELNDNGVGTYLGEVSNNAVDVAVQSAASSGQPVSFFSAATFTVYGLPNGLCQFTSLQIPVGEGKSFTCTFTCGG
jgi:hypothetical protein